MKPPLLIAAGLGAVVLQSGCFIVRHAVVDTVKTGAYVAKKGTHVVMKTGEVAAKETVKGGESAVHAITRTGEGAAVAPAPAPVPTP